jgi:glutamine amidotransferase
MIAIVKYNAGNIRSVQNALNRLGASYVLTDDPESIRSAEKVIFPGVGEASSAMSYLKYRKLDQLIPKLKQPLLGICLGQQLLCKHSEESDTACLGIFDAQVKRFPPIGLIPHMGWNNLTQIKGDLFKNLNPTDDLYFIHSYYAEVCEQTTAVCDYLLPFSAALQKDNFYATQFHPEKSADAGEIILENFLKV